MEVYILDSLYRRIEVVDTFESLVWAERFSTVGDFELDIVSTLENRRRFVEGVRLVTNESYRVMTVETVTDYTDEEGRRVLKIKGSSLEGVFQHRMAWNGDDLTTDPKWVLEGTPKEVADQLFHDICVTGIVDTGDIISGIVEANIFTTDTIEFPDEEVVYSLDPKDLYTALKDLCDAFHMGFRIVRDLDTSILYFDVYMGSDRTTSQSTLPAVVFSPDLDNLRNTTKLTSNAIYKNAAYVISKMGATIVYADGVDPSVSGFERRALVVVADDIDDPIDGMEQMIQRGKEELAKNRRVTLLDGEISTTSEYKYGVHYNLGDLVELRDDDGARSQMRVTEQIFVSDKEGDRSYPTLTMTQFVVPGSWGALPADLRWQDLTTETWDDI